MPNDFYSATGTPAQGSAGASAPMRAEFNAIVAAFDKLPTLAGNAGRVVTVNAGATALTVSNALTIVGSDVTVGGAMTAASFNAVADIASLRVQFATTAGVNGVRVANQAGDRRFELLHLGSTHPGVYGAVANDAVVNVSGAGKLVFSMADTVRAQLTQSGLFGVGIAPAERIHTEGNIWSQGGSLYLSPASLAVMGAVGSFNSDATNGGLTLSTRLAGTLTETARLTQTGTFVVGFTGAIYPAANRRTLEVNGASESLVGLARAGTGTAYLHSTPTALRLMQVENLGFLLGTNNVDRLSISNQGNVGIAAPSSGYALTVTPLTSNGGVLVAAGAASNSALFGGSSSAGNSAFMQLAGNGNAIGSTDFLIGQDSAGQANLINRANVLLKLGTNNLERLTITADGRLYGTALHNNAGSLTGTVNQYIASGTYTPTGTAVANVSIQTPRQAQWLRVGNVVTVTGSVNITPTAAGSTATVLGLSLPIPSNFASTEDCAGVAIQGSASAQTSGAVVQGDTVNDRASLGFFSLTTAGNEWSYTYSYEIL